MQNVLASAGRSARADTAHFGSRTPEHSRKTRKG